MRRRRILAGVLAFCIALGAYGGRGGYYRAGDTGQSEETGVSEAADTAEDAARKETEKAAKEAAEAAAKQAAQEEAEKAAKEAAEAAAKQAAQEEAEKDAKEAAAKEAAQEEAEKAAKEAAEAAAKEAVQEEAEKAAKEAAEKAAEAAEQEEAEQAAKETDQETDKNAGEKTEEKTEEETEEKTEEETGKETGEETGKVEAEDGKWSLIIHGLSDGARMKAVRKTAEDPDCAEGMELAEALAPDRVFLSAYQVRMEEGGIICETGCTVELIDETVKTETGTRLFLITGEDEKKARELDFQITDGVVEFTAPGLGLFLFLEEDIHAEERKSLSEETAQETYFSEESLPEEDLESITEGEVPEEDPESITEGEAPEEEALESITEGEMPEEEALESITEGEEPEEPLTEEEPIEDAVEEEDLTESAFLMRESVMVGLMAVAAAPASQTAEVTSGKKLYVPSKWRMTDGSPYGYAVRFYAEVDGSRKIAYCLEPAKGGGDPGSYKAVALAAKGDLSANEANRIKRALFYLYGGPGWDLAGLKSILKSCSSDDDYYVASHYILAKLYCVAVGEKWNVVISGGNTYTALSSTGVSEVNAAIDKLDSLPVPTASVSTTTVKGNYNASYAGAVSENVTYTSNVSGNNLTFTVPTGVSAVVAGKEYAAGSTATVKPGQTFFFRKKGYTQAHNQTITLKAATFTDYEGYIIYMSGGYQDKGYAYVDSKSIKLTVRWPDLAGGITLGKTSTDPKVGAVYDFTGAEYTVYKADGTTQYAVMKLSSDGKASLSGVPFGTYKIKETKQPTNLAYRLDPTVYEVKVPGTSSAQVSVSVKEEPLRTGLQVIKRIEGEEDAGAEAIAGIRFVLTHEDGAVEEMEAVTDETGSASFEGLPVGTYTLTEDPETVPEGYLCAEPVTVVVKGAEGADAAAVIECDALDEEGNLIITNEPGEQSGSIQFEALKTLEKGKLKEEMFSFALYGPEGDLLQTKTNDADGKVLFDAISFTSEDIG